MSLAFQLTDAQRWTGAERLQGAGDVTLAGVSTDSRTLAAGQLFVAIRGPQHDAHDHLAQAVGAGAAALLIERGRALPAGLPPGLAVLTAPDTTRALGDLARGHRDSFDGPLVAITGSCGKTTTKEMCAAILELGAPTLRNAGNLNNCYGLPLTLLARSAEHRRIVVELGMNHRGEIARLAEIARPTIGLVTNVGSAHIEHLGSREAIALEKGDLLAALPAGGTALVNQDDACADELAARSPARVMRFGSAQRAEVRARAWRRAGPATIAFELETPEGNRAIEVQGLGEPALSNALGAAAAALAAGACLDEIDEGLARYRPAHGRLERRELASGVILIDDSYNANPEALAAALRLLAEDPARGRRIAVIGDMGELGALAESAHREAGARVAQLGIDRLVAVGQHAGEVVGGARAAGMPAAHIADAPDSASAGPLLRELLGAGDCVLVKGSRSTRMELVIRSLEAEESR